MTEDEKATLVTALILLLDGKPPDEIADALFDALGHKRTNSVAARLDYHAGISFGMSLSPEDIHQEIENRNEWWEEGTYKYVGTPEQLISECQDYSWGDNGDQWAGERDNLFEQLEKAGLIAHSPPDLPTGVTP